MPTVMAYIDGRIQPTYVAASEDIELDLTPRSERLHPVSRAVIVAATGVITTSAYAGVAYHFQKSPWQNGLAMFISTAVVGVVATMTASLVVLNL
jgi:hypothetical protein